VVKALALGAHAVLVGRVLLYGLAAAGERGAHATLEMLTNEISRTLALLGVRDTKLLNRHHVASGGEP
jgi:(S)-mandelate dehydrogenase